MSDSNKLLIFRNFFYKSNRARRCVFVGIILLWLAQSVLHHSEPGWNDVALALFVSAGVLALAYYFHRFALAFLYLFTTNLVVYQVLFWFGLFAAVLGVLTMTGEMEPKAFENYSLSILVALAVSWAARANYFDFAEKKK